MSVFYVQESKNGQTSEALARKVYGQATSSAFVMFRFNRARVAHPEVSTWNMGRCYREFAVSSIFPGGFSSLHIPQKLLKIIAKASTSHM